MYSQTLLSWTQRNGNEFRDNQKIGILRWRYLKKNIGEGLKKILWYFHGIYKMSVRDDVSTVFAFNDEYFTSFSLKIKSIKIRSLSKPVESN